jgi:hypothetical protein
LIKLFNSKSNWSLLWKFTEQQFMIILIK